MNHLDTTFSDRDILSTRLLWFLFFILLVFILSLSIYKKFDRDEFESVHVAWKIFSGGVIYVDFLEQHQPFFYYMLVPLIEAFKVNVSVLMAARSMVFSMLLAIFFITYNMARNLFNKESAVISLILLATTEIFILKAVEIRPDVPQTLFSLLALSLLFRYFQKKFSRYLILSSMSLGVSFLFLQKSVFFACIIGAILLFRLCLKQIRSRDVFLYFLLFISTLAPFYLYLFLKSQLHAYLMCNYFYNFSNTHWEMSRSQIMTLGLISSFRTSPQLWILLFLSFFFLNSSNQKILGCMSVGVLIIFFLMQFQNTQYYMPLMPLIAMMAGFAVHKMSRSFFKYRPLILWAMVVLCIFYPVKLYLNMIRDPSNTNMYQLNEVGYVLAVTKPKDFVYDGSIQFNLFRKDLDFFWYLTKQEQSPPWGHYDIYKLINKFEPKVITAYKIPDMADKRIAQHYQASDKYPDLFIRIK